MLLIFHVGIGAVMVFNSTGFVWQEQAVSQLICLRPLTGGSHACSMNNEVCRVCMEFLFIRSFRTQLCRA